MAELYADLPSTDEQRVIPGLVLDTSQYDTQRAPDTDVLFYNSDDENVSDDGVISSDLKPDNNTNEPDVRQLTESGPARPGYDNEAEEVFDNEPNNIIDNEPNNIFDNEAEEVFDNEAEEVFDNEAEEVFDNEAEEVFDNEPNNIIDNIYISMSKIIESLNTDNLLLNLQAKRIHEELEFVCQTIAELKLENQRVVIHVENKLANSAHESSIMEIVNKLKSKIEGPTIIKFNDLQKQIIDTRTLLLRTLTTSIGQIKKELMEVCKIKGDLRPQVKSVVAEEVKSYMASMPTLDAKFNNFAKEQRASLSQHIRRSTVHRVSSMKSENSILITAVRDQIASVDKTHEIANMQKQYVEFVQSTNTMMANMQEKIRLLEMK
jgi:hypothetical protein